MTLWTPYTYSRLDSQRQLVLSLAENTSGSCRADLDHVNCLGRAKPTRKQLAAHHVVRSALASNPSLAARNLVAQLRHQEGMSASQNTRVSRGRNHHVSNVFQGSNHGTHLPSFLAELQRLNPGVYTAFECYKSGYFRRAIVVLKADWFLQGQGVYGVDAAHVKHRRYNGVKLILVGRDGNFANQIAAVALAPFEDYDNYAWFFGCVLAQEFPLKTCPTFSDRNVGLVSAAVRLDAFNMHCVRHIIGNMRADKLVRLTVRQEKFVWAANAATTQDLFEAELKKLEGVNTNAAVYLRAMPAAKWALYPHFKDRPLYGWRTTNFVDYC